MDKKSQLMKKTLLLLVSVLVICCQKKDHPSENDLELKAYSKEQLTEDFDLLTNSLKEAHTGIYWYSTEQQFDSIVTEQRNKITDSLNSLEFYNITAPIVAFTKEDHCDIYLDKAAKKGLSKKGKFLPISVITLQGKVYVLNNPAPDIIIKGYQLLKINNKPTEDIYASIFNTFAADGFIKSSKYRYLDGGKFAIEYAKTIARPDTFEIIVLNPETNKEKTYKIPSVDAVALTRINKSLYEEGIFKRVEVPAKLDIIDNSTAVLTINTFDDDDYEEEDMNFKTFIENSFSKLEELNIKNLIIDLRENGGGTEGNEDYIFSYLTDKPYNKYKYVQASAFSYSFYKYSDYDAEDVEELETDIKEQHYLADDGKILRKAGINVPTAIQPNPFMGNVYLLTSGWTYSGGAEFCSLMKEHTNAVFVGEEVGGGFLGNTSGYSIELTLPNTGIAVDLPLLKFVLDVSENRVPYGRGVIPDHKIQPTINEFLKGYDTPMEYTKKLIAENN